eukprot:5537588-Prymnesium_polylepis.1
MKLKDAWWFEEPVPADTEGYFETISTPMDYGTIDGKLKGGQYEGEVRLPGTRTRGRGRGGAAGPHPLNHIRRPRVIRSALWSARDPIRSVRQLAFAADVRLVASNAMTYSPDPNNDCNEAARAHLAAFERLYVKQGLATDGGAAASAAEEAAKPSTRKKQKVG